LLPFWLLAVSEAEQLKGHRGNFFVDKYYAIFYMFWLIFAGLQLAKKSTAKIRKSKQDNT